MPKPYRDCVVGVFIDSQGQLLLGERSDLPGTWQLPQGGVEAGETHEMAIYREMHEELGVSKFEIINKIDSAVYYDFPPNLDSPLGKKFRGQSQIWYLLKFSEKIDLKQLNTKEEFRAYKWDSVANTIDQAIEWKKDVYNQGLRGLGLQARI
ncbi:MAG: RNA pyrophosphohydrolase [Oligoflexales bacterium]|nr:RNA pyrophosphohydrolase [Oligoflexales bacterium]